MKNTDKKQQITGNEAEAEVTLTTLEEMVEASNENGKVEAIPQEILTEMADADAEAKKQASLAYALMEVKDFYNVFFTPVISKDLTEAEVEAEVKVAICYEAQVVTLSEEGMLEINTVKKPLTFKDVYKAYLDHLAEGHADNTKITKEDRVKASSRYYNNLGDGYLDLFTHSACKYMAIGTDKYTLNAVGKVAKNSIDKACKEAKRENPFDKTSSTGYNEQIEAVVGYFLPTKTFKLNAYYAQGAFQMIASRNKYGRLTIASIEEVMQIIAIVCRYASNKYKLPTKDKSRIYKADKTK